MAKGSRIVSQAEIEHDYQIKQMWFKRSLCATYLLAGKDPPKEWLEHTRWVKKHAKLLKKNRTLGVE